ncbi:MAG: histidine kinase [Gordonia paraffinivorans]
MARTTTRGRPRWPRPTDLPVEVDPAVSAFLARRSNVSFTLVGLVMFSVAWPVLPLTHEVFVVVMPVIAGLSSLPVVLAWARPALGLAISLAAALVIGVAVPRVDGWGWRVSVVHIIVLLVLAAMTFLRGPLRLAPLWWAATCAVFAVSAPPEARAGWVAGVTVLAIVCGLLRAVVRSRRDLAHESELKDVADARTAVLAERARIARDLHDVVAHRMSVVVVAAQTARYRVDGVGPAADAEFQAIAGSAREALDEVRQLLGVLRVDDGVAPLPPAPGVADIGELVAATRAAGVAVSARLQVPDETIAEGVGLAAYRIVQEALANAVRHAPGAPIDIAVVAEDEQITVAVVNARTAPQQPAGGPGVGGHGIAGMTERARSVGGALVAGPDESSSDTGRFRVLARLPVRAGLASPTTSTSSGRSTSTEVELW